MKPLCIYHGNCADGFAAAWVVRKHFGEGNCDFHAGVYQDSPPDVTGRDVILVDFSYRRDVLQKMAMFASSIIVLDHHKTAMEDLTAYKAWKESILLHFDMERSGAMITWNWYFPNQEPPQLIKHIQDRDLWKFELPATREIQAGVFSYPYEFDVWDTLMQNELIPSLIAGGSAIERKHHKDIAELTELCMYWQMIGGIVVPIASMPYTLVSDAASNMARVHAPRTFAGCYWDTPKHRIFGLRSIEGGMDVSEIAKQYGGGGHKNAAGFRIPWSHPLAVATPFIK